MTRPIISKAVPVPTKLPPPGNDARGRCINCRGTGTVDWDGTGCMPSTCPDCEGDGKVAVPALGGET